jgi:hypothetical protein
MGAAKLTPETRCLIARLARAGWTDDQIAEVVGVNRPNVCLARKRLGVPAAYSGRTREAFRRAQQERFEAAFEPLGEREFECRATPLDIAEAREEAWRVIGRLGSEGTRDRELTLDRAMGESLAELGRKHGITRERVRQVCTRVRRRCSQ